MPLTLSQVRDRLRELHLPFDDHVGFGSVPLLAHGIVATVGDIDILARRRAWELARARGSVSTAPHHDLVIELPGSVEVFNGWMGLEVDAIIDSGSMVAGIWVADLRHVLAFKRLLGRPKDRPHIEAIERSIGGR